jgi:hypothetical protein
MLRGTEGDGSWLLPPTILVIRAPVCNNHCCYIGRRGADKEDVPSAACLAFDWPRYSKRKYDAAQRDAEHAPRGMWTGSYVEPWLYRACIRLGGRPTDCSMLVLIPEVMSG